MSCRQVPIYASISFIDLLPTSISQLYFISLSYIVAFIFNKKADTYIYPTSYSRENTMSIVLSKEANKNSVFFLVQNGFLK